MFISDSSNIIQHEQYNLPERSEKTTKSFISHNFIIILLGMQALVFSLEMTIYQSYIVLYLTDDLFISITMITLIISLQNFLQVFLRIPLADLSQTFGRKTIIIIGNLTMASSLACLFFAGSFVLPVLGGIFFAIGMSSFWPAIFAYLADIQTVQYGKNAGKMFLLGDFGIVVASFMAKYLLDNILIALKYLFFITAVLGVVIGILLALLMPELLAKGKKRSSNLKVVANSFILMAHSFMKVSSLPGWKTVVIYQIIVAYLDYTFYIFFPVLIVNHGFSLGTVGDIFFWGSLIPLAAYPYLGKIIDKFGYKVPTTLGICVASFTILVCIQIYTILLFILAYIIMVLCLVTGYTGLNSIAAKPADESLRGVSLGVLGVYISIGRVLSIILSGVLWDIYNLNAIFILSAFFAVLLVVLMHVMPAKHQDMVYNLET